VVTMHCTGSAYSSAASGAGGGATAIGGGVRRSAGAAVGEGGTRVVLIGVDGLRSGGDGGGGVRGVGGELGVERGDKTGGGGEWRRGERRKLPSSPSSLNSSSLYRLIIAFLVRFAGGGDVMGEWRGSKDSSVG
jgi:hypothetical protein